LGELRDTATQKFVTPRYSRSVWFTDRNENIALSIRHKGDRIFHEKSPYQTVEIFDTFEYGKMLTVDKMVMCSEKDEKAYHEMIIHVPMMTPALTLKMCWSSAGATVAACGKSSSIPPWNPSPWSKLMKRWCGPHGNICPPSRLRAWMILN
jgi:hypothetical protein